MKTNLEILQIASRVISEQGKAVQNLTNYLTEDFPGVVRMVLESKGRVIISGVGKSALIAAKIVATFNSTGTPSVFVHAADAIHGDLGNIQKDDLVIIISKSGNTPEIKALVPLVKKLAFRTVAITGNIKSFLATHCDYVLDATVERETCPNNLAPTTSTMAQMMIGDALAVALEEARGFTPQDFGRFHPGGALGKQLYMLVEDVIMNNEVPLVFPETPVRGVIAEISSKRLGVTAVVDDASSRNIVGIITDGDVRRMLEKTDTIAALTASDIMSANPKSIEKDTLAVKALEVLQKYNISNLLVVDNGRYCGVIHMHDLMREGIL